MADAHGSNFTWVCSTWRGAAETGVDLLKSTPLARIGHAWLSGFAAARQLTVAPNRGWACKKPTAVAAPAAAQQRRLNRARLQNVSAKPFADTNPGVSALERLRHPSYLLENHPGDFQERCHSLAAI